MAVPKFKTSKSKKRKRRTHDHLTPPRRAERLPSQAEAGRVRLATHNARATRPPIE